MNLDQYGLPRQVDGDCNDQLQRVGMVLTAGQLDGKDHAKDELFITCLAHLNAVSADSLQIEPGVFVRFVGGNPNTVSCDQLISALCAFVSMQPFFPDRSLWPMFWQMLKRFGFAQNTRDGLSNDRNWKIPDVMIFRAMPLFCRAHWLIYPFACLADFYLLCMVFGAYLYGRQSYNNVDDNNLIMTLAVCQLRSPTPLSRLATRIYKNIRPWNYGCTPFDTLFDAKINDRKTEDWYQPIYGALRWYHRAEAKGNPEIAARWQFIIGKVF